MHANAEILSRLAEAAALQGKFWAMHSHLMGHRGVIHESDVFADAAAVGVDMARVRRDVLAEAVRLRIEANVQSGKASGVHSTPSFFFDGLLHDGHYDYDTLAAKLEEGAAQRLPMKILATIDVVQGADLAELRGQLPAELRGSWSLFESGVLREAYATASPTRVVFVLEAESIADAHAHLQKLPLVASGSMRVELVELRAFVNWSLLFAK